MRRSTVGSRRGDSARHRDAPAASLDLDLNLLLALRALLTERHVTRAAARVGITQPAMSHALSRLRAHLGDPLLVRTRTGMQLTPRGEQLAEPIERTLDDLTKLLSPPEPFEPARSTRAFRIATSDYVELVLMPKVLESIWKVAPGVIVRLRSLVDRGSDDLDSGKVDLVLGPGGALATPRSGIFTQSAFRERFVCVVRSGHPAIRENARVLGLDRFLALPHALVSPRGDSFGIVDTALAKLGHRRRIVVDVPHFLVAPFLVEHTDLVLTVAERVARTLAASANLKILAPPAELDVPGFEITTQWHERHRADPAHIWLRGLIASVAKTI